MHLSALGVTSITDFILAGEAFFFGGLLVARRKRRWSAAWFWQIALLLLAIGAFVGGVDHGFFQIAGDTHTRKAVQHTTWFVIGVLTLVTFLTVVEQFLEPRWRRVLYTVAGLQFVVYLLAIRLLDSYAVVIASYASIMVWSLLCNIRGLRDGTGTWPMILGILVALAASAVQATGLRLSESVDHNGLYHAGMMMAVWLSYRGGLRLKGFAP